MGLSIGGLSDYVNFKGTYDVLGNNGETIPSKDFIDFIFNSDGDDLRGQVGTIGTFNQQEFFERFKPIVADGTDTGGIAGKKDRDKYNPYVKSERQAEYDFRTGKWEYSDTKKRPYVKYLV